MTEARRFLGLRVVTPPPAAPACAGLGDRAEAAERLCRPIEGTPAEAYLRTRGIEVGREPALGFHPALFYRDAAGSFSTYPALVARAVHPDGAFAGLQRTYLDPARRHQAGAECPRRRPRKPRRRDRAMVVRLVERAMRGELPRGPCTAEPADLPVLRHLAEGTASRGVRTLARAVGRSVARAVRTGDRAALARLYDRLLGLDLPVSPALARTLRLFDHVGLPATAAAAPQGPTALTVSE